MSAVTTSGDVETVSVTNDKGEYLLVGLSAATYNLRVLADGYEYRVEYAISVSDSSEASPNHNL